MAATKNHDYHLVEPDPWPLIGALAAGIMFGGLVMWFHANPYGKFVFALGLLGVLVTMYNWWGNTIREAHTGYHTPVVQLHLRYGMIMFIASEVMFFLAWFWAFFDASLFPSAVDAVGGQWPPKGIEVLDPWGFPLLNTMILLCSGTTVTWAHHSLIHGNRDGLKLGLLLTILLGATFTFVQGWEYAHAPFAFKGSIYGSTFFMATGFHGFHVLVGTIFLIVCLVRANRGDSTPRQHFGFEAAAWYWHFVDVVWLFLFTVIYVWGGWGRAARGVSPSDKPEISSARAALQGLCPRCGERTLFAGLASFANGCPACALDFASFNVGDGPAAFLIFIVGTITVVGALVLDGAVSPPMWVHLIWIPVAAALTIGGLRLSKGWLLAQEYKHRAREGRIAS